METWLNTLEHENELDTLWTEKLTERVNVDDQEHHLPNI